MKMRFIGDLCTAHCSSAKYRTSSFAFYGAKLDVVQFRIKYSDVTVLACVRSPSFNFYLSFFILISTINIMLTNVRY